MGCRRFHSQTKEDTMDGVKSFRKEYSIFFSITKARYRHEIKFGSEIHWTRELSQIT